jgi:hypothetical protein
MLAVCPPSTSSPYTFTAAGGQPPGTSYKWEIVSGGDKAHIVGNDHNDYVWLQPDAGGAGTLRCRYTKWDSTQNQDVSCDSTRSFWVQAPTQANSTRQINGFSSGYQDGYYWMGRTVTYTVKDQAGMGGYPICHAWWDETFSNDFPPACTQLIQQGDGWTNAEGKPDNPPWNADVFFWYQQDPWDGWSLICDWTQTIKVSDCPENEDFWRNHIRFDQTPWIEVTPE